MSKRSHKALASATVMSLILTSTLSAVNVSAAATVERTGGSDRIATSQEVAKQVFGKAETVVLVNGYGYADAVSATPLAKQLNAPILLTNEAEKPSADLTATLASLGAKKVVIVGGTGVVKTALETELAKSYEVERIAGTSRYETNANVAKKVVELTKSTKGVLVSAAGYADALSVASIAASKGMPVLFGNANEVPAEVKEAAKGLELVAVGGTAVLPDTVLESVKATRIASGADRFETNLKVLEYFEGDLKDVKNIFMAAGGASGDANFADALVASAAAAKYGAPVVLTGFGANKTNVDASIKYVKDHMKDDSKVTIVGGTGVVSEDIEKELKGEKADGKNEVSSIEAVNLNQIKVTFATKVDGDTAEDVRNYELDGTQLVKYDDEKDEVADSDAAIAELQDDDKTVIITLAKIESQEKEKTLKVRKGVLIADKSKLIEEAEKEVTFKDLVAPEVTNVEVKGNSKLKIDFSEPVLVNATSKNNALETLAQEIEINGKTIKSIGYDAKYSELNNVIRVSNNNYYITGVEFYLDTALDSGTNTVTIPEGEKDKYLVDAVGFFVKEKDVDVKVESMNDRPVVKSVKGSTDGKIYINFDRPMDQKTVEENKNRFKLNSSEVNSSCEIELEEDDTQIKLSGVESVLTGSNTIEIPNKVRDAYGNKVENNLRESFNADKDEAKPKVNNVLTVDDSTIRVVFNKDVSKSSATSIRNYTLRDSKGSKVTLDSDVESVSDSIYDIKLSKDKLDGSKYTLKVESVSDLAGNIMDEKTFTINGEAIVPEVDKAVKVDDKKDNKVVVIFKQEMKSSTVNKTENYKYKNGKGEVKTLPSDSKITLESDNKTVTIEFPESYKIFTENNVDDARESNDVKSIIVTKDVESANGEKMNADETVSIKSSGQSKIELTEEPMRLKDDKGDALVTVKFTGAVKEYIYNKGDENFAPVEFVDGADTEQKSYDKVVSPDNITVNGDTVEFRFKDDNADKVMAIGSDLKLQSKGSLKLLDAAHQNIDTTKLVNGLKKVNINEVKPELLYEETSDYVIAAKDSSDANFKAWYVDEEGTITVKFNTKIDKNSVGTKDFNFQADSSKLDIEDVEVKGNTAIYTITDAESLKLLRSSDELRVKLNKDDIKIESKVDKDDTAEKFDKDSIGNNETLKIDLSKIFNKKLIAVNKAENNADMKAALEAILERAVTVDEAKDALKNMPEAGYKDVEQIKTAIKPEIKFVSKTNSDTANDVETLGIIGKNAKSSDDKIATAAVDVKNNKITITSVAPGTAKITVGDGNTTEEKTATINVTVNADGTIVIGTIVPAK